MKQINGLIAIALSTLALGITGCNKEKTENIPHSGGSEMSIVIPSSTEGFSERATRAVPGFESHQYSFKTGDMLHLYLRIYTEGDFQTKPLSIWARVYCHYNTLTLLANGTWKMGGDPWIAYRENDGDPFGSYRNSSTHWKEKHVEVDPKTGYASKILMTSDIVRATKLTIYSTLTYAPSSEFKPEGDWDDIHLVCKDPKYAGVDAVYQAQNTVESSIGLWQTAINSALNFTNKPLKPIASRLRVYTGRAGDSVKLMSPAFIAINNHTTTTIAKEPIYPTDKTYAAVTNEKGNAYFYGSTGVNGELILNGTVDEGIPVAIDKRFNISMNNLSDKSGKKLPEREVFIPRKNITSSHVQMTYALSETVKFNTIAIDVSEQILDTAAPKQ